jgi:large subunit ribosomal protein L13
MICIDATDQVLGRLASSVARMVLSGEEVRVVNAEKAAVIGNPKMIVSEFKAKRDRGDPYHGPFYPSSPDRILKRTVRGMLPYKTARGKEAFKRLRAFISIPPELEGKEFRKIEGTANKGEEKSVTLKEISEMI